MFDEGRDFIFFGSFSEIAGQIENWSCDEEGGLNWFASPRFAEVRALAQRHFWDLATSAIEPKTDNRR